MTLKVILMNRILFFLSFLVSIFSFSQHKVIHNAENSMLIKGNIEGSAITIFLENQEIIVIGMTHTLMVGIIMINIKSKFR